MKTVMKIAMTLIMAVAVTSLAAQPQGRGERNSNPEDMAKRMTESMTTELGLTEAQQKEVYDLQLKMIKERRPAAGADRSNPPSEEDMKARREEMNKSMENYKAGLKKILSDEQFDKWEKANAERMRQRGDRPDRSDRSNRTTPGDDKSSEAKVKSKKCTCQECSCDTCACKKKSGK